MAFYSLVSKPNNGVVQFVESQEETFEVHEDFMWVAGPETVDEGCGEPDYYYDPSSNSIQKKEVPTPPYDLARRYEFDSFGEQLDMLWHDMDLGLVPGKDGTWYKRIKEIKDSNPKPAE